MVKVVVLGCGEAFDESLGNNSFLLVEKGGPRLLIDCGYQVPPLLWRTKEGQKELQGLVLTHMHADHSFGVPALLYRMREEGHKGPLRIVGPLGSKKFIHRIAQWGYPGIWEKLGRAVEWVEMRPGRPLQWNGDRGPLLLGAYSQHSIRNLSWRFDWPGGASLGFSGDGRMTRETMKLFQGVDLLFQEVYSVRPMTEFHSSLEDVMTFANMSPRTRIVVTHVSRKERKGMERALQKRGDGQWELAFPGQTYLLR